MRWELLDRYMAGECTIAERAGVERWLQESPVRWRLLAQLSRSNPTVPSLQKARARAQLERELDSRVRLGGNGV
jgi:ferric-dicitrate binding protein FerR (iron transport regulator)